MSHDRPHRLNDTPYLQRFWNAYSYDRRDGYSVVEALKYARQVAKPHVYQVDDPESRKIYVAPEGDCA